MRKQTSRGHWAALPGSRRTAAGSFPEACSGTFRGCSTTLCQHCWTSLLVKSFMTHSISIKPALQAFGSIPGGSVQCNCEDKFKCLLANRIASTSVGERPILRSKLIQVVILGILGPFSRELQSQSGVGDLVDPDAGRDVHGALDAGPLLTGLGGHTRLAAKLPAGVNEGSQGLRRLEDPDQPELLDAETEACLDLEHLHKRFLLGLVIQGNALPRASARSEDFHAEVAEDRVARRLLDGGLGAGLHFVELRQDLLRILADLLPLLVCLRLLFFVLFLLLGKRRCGNHESDRQDQETYLCKFPHNDLLSIDLFTTASDQTASPTSKNKNNTKK